MTFLSSGNVGIGTTSPPHPLTVAGVISGSGTGYFGNIILGGTEQIAVNNGNLYYTGGNLGIGTANPEVALDVVGDVKIKGDLTAETLIISSSVTNLTTQFASGSTRFGESQDDIHEVTGYVIGSGGLVYT